jgi:hypothetical protein
LWFDGYKKLPGEPVVREKRNPAFTPRICAKDRKAGCSVRITRRDFSLVSARRGERIPGLFHARN